MRVPLLPPLAAVLAFGLLSVSAPARAGENAETRIEFRNVFVSDVDIAREAGAEFINSGVTHEPRFPDGHEVIAACTLQAVSVDETASI